MAGLTLTRRVERLEASGKRLIEQMQRVFAQQAQLHADQAQLTATDAHVSAFLTAMSNWAWQVTEMMRAVDWDKLTAAYTGGGPGGTPPADPPTWP